MTNTGRTPGGHPDRGSALMTSRVTLLKEAEKIKRVEELEDRREEKDFMRESTWWSGKEGEGAAAGTLLHEADLEDNRGPRTDVHGTHALHAWISSFLRPEYRQLLCVF